MSKLRSQDKDLSQQNQATPTPDVENDLQPGGNEAAQADMEVQAPEEGILSNLGAEGESLGVTAGPPHRVKDPKKYNWSVRYKTKAIKGDDGEQVAPVSTIEERVDLSWAMPNEDRSEVDEVFGQHTRTSTEKGGETETEIDNSDYMASFSKHLGLFEKAAGEAKNGSRRGRRIRKPNTDKRWPQKK